MLSFINKSDRVSHLGGLYGTVDRELSEINTSKMTTALPSETQGVPRPLELARLNARTSIRCMRGQTGAYLLDVPSGRAYATKYQNNIFGPKALVNEWIGYLLLRHIDLPVPSCALIEVPEDIDADGGL
jgi:hypothetical protein